MDLLSKILTSLYFLFPLAIFLTYRSKKWKQNIVEGNPEGRFLRHKANVIVFSIYLGLSLFFVYINTDEFNNFLKTNHNIHIQDLIIFISLGSSATLMLGFLMDIIIEPLWDALATYNKQRVMRENLLKLNLKFHNSILFEISALDDFKKANPEEAYEKKSPKPSSIYYLSSVFSWLGFLFLIYCLFYSIKESLFKNKSDISILWNKLRIYPNLTSDEVKETLKQIYFLESKKFPLYPSYFHPSCLEVLELNNESSESNLQLG